ncbi:winged helix-turn-helix transcriptional regulator [Promicromonospora iranensis]|uniref:DNA-binding HxlR family transcriptional regulator n=1 Tax=Promicromonospora iranensis TaxID=1105144 RepID=A0ABU2CLA8_9MICO|nr:helix-turn-helix domain-containing protein [Promicromonospora iranensis]MDR7382124.1 DNA-binding HxlR family transcriptional regulator [Promicromonospora iranensis]
MNTGTASREVAPSPSCDPFHTECPARDVLDHVTSRWGVWVLIRLQEEPLRFSELRDRIEGVSEKMLSQTLRNLTQDGLVWRKVEPTTPPQVTYGLTPLGSGLGHQLAAMLGWIEAHADHRDAVTSGSTGL